MPLRRPAVLLLAALPHAAQAHSFGQLYNLPVPLWLYAWGAMAALLLSFLVAGYFLKVPVAVALPARREISDHPLLRLLLHPWSLNLLRSLSLAALALCIATGLFGSANPYANFNMTLFWILFVLGYAWLSVLIGDLYALISPWRWLVDGLGRLWPRYAQGLLRYPLWLGLWPAYLLYSGFIWVELFGGSNPHSLALLLLGYTLLNLLGAGLVGASAWFAHCEFFAVLLRLLAKMAPVEIDAQARATLRRPCAGLVQTQAASYSEVLFVLAMLATTAYDGLHETRPWVRLFWSDFYGLIRPWVGSNPVAAYGLLRPYYLVWQQLALFAAPFLYFGLYLLFIRLAKWAGGSALSTRTLALRFAYSLLPIALVYHLSHYWTLMLSQGLKIVPLLSDPFGSGANYFGTASWFSGNRIPDMGLVWHTQVGLIVAGHIVSVVVAHLIALRSFASARAATLSQLPMLLLMLLLTAAGLWILAQPLEAPLL